MNVSASSEHHCCAVLELRQYTLKPGHRDTLIALFDRHFIESQEAVGITVVGQFLDRRRPDRFVWMRGFPDMKSRHVSLEQFYSGPVWAAHRSVANDTMLDSNDVLLLKPARPDLALRLNPHDRPAPGEDRTPAVVLAGIHQLRHPADDAIVSRFEHQAIATLRANGVHIDGIFVTEPAPNTFTRLPVREGEEVLVWFGTLQHRSMPVTRHGVPSVALLKHLGGSVSSLADQPAVLLELDPTPRSLLGHHWQGLPDIGDAR